AAGPTRAGPRRRPFRPGPTTTAPAPRTRAPAQRRRRRAVPADPTADGTRRDGRHAGYRSGVACLVGRPNAGKSTLTNALVGSKVAITSSKPQTTRHTIRGIRTTDDAQLVLVDTPGLHRPRSLLGQRLNNLVRETLLSVDVIG